MKKYNDFESFSKDQAYWERNQLVCALSKLFTAWIEKHPAHDTEWSPQWRNIIYIVINGRQLSWHIHDDDLEYFNHLKFKSCNSWDGHNTQEKYDRLLLLIPTQKPH